MKVIFSCDILLCISSSMSYKDQSRIRDMASSWYLCKLRKAAMQLGGYVTSFHFARIFKKQKINVILEEKKEDFWGNAVNLCCVLTVNESKV